MIPGNPVWACPGCGSVGVVSAVSRVSGGLKPLSETLFLCAACCFEVFACGQRTALRIWGQAMARVAAHHPLYQLDTLPRDEAIKLGVPPMFKSTSKSITDFIRSKLERVPPANGVGIVEVERRRLEGMLSAADRFKECVTEALVMKADLEAMLPEVERRQKLANDSKRLADTAAARLAEYRAGRSAAILAAIEEGRDPADRLETPLAIEAAELQEAAKVAARQLEEVSAKRKTARDALRAKREEAIAAFMLRLSAQLEWTQRQEEDLMFELRQVDSFRRSADFLAVERDDAAEPDCVAIRARLREELAPLVKVSAALA